LHDLRLTLVEADYFMAGSLDADEARVRRALIARLRKPEVRRHLEETSTEARERPGDFRTRTESTTNRLRPFVANDRMKCMFGQVNSLDWGEVLNEGGIVLCNISQDDARLYEEDTRVLGSTILHDLWHAARARRKDANHPTAYLYLDEFQEFVSPTVAKELSQSAGFGLSLTLAHQFPTQLLNEGRDGKATYDAVLGNAQNKAVFHMEHPADLAMLAEVLFLSIFNPKKILLALNSIKVVGYREVTREVMIPRQPAVFAKSYPGRRSDILLR
jgi:hypothetical protein